MGEENSWEEFALEVLYSDAQRLIKAIRDGDLVRVEQRVDRLKVLTELLLEREGQLDGDV
jgi:hypothetical protein